MAGLALCETAVCKGVEPLTVLCGNVTCAHFRFRWSRDTINFLKKY